MSVLSKSCVYGLRAILYVAGFAGDRTYVPIREIAGELKLSFHFLTKIFQQLTEKGLVVSYRGPNGGIALARDPGTITLFDVVRAIDGDDLFNGCVLGLAECSDDHPCPLHELWGAQRAQLSATLQHSSLGELRLPVLREEIRLRDRVKRTRTRKI